MSTSSISKKAVVIGAGVAGLAMAVRLAVQGFSVEVFESNDYPGGKLSHFEKDGFHFDAGPSLFTQPQNIEDLFEFAGASIHEYFTYEKVDVACQYFFEDKKIIKAHSDKDKFANELFEKLGEDPMSLHRYLSDAEKLYENVGSIFLNHSLHKKDTWLHRRIWKALRTVKISYLMSTLNRHNEKRFKTKESVQIFNRFATYNGSNPYKAPGMLSVIPHLEQNQGTYYPHGGMISITNALYRLALNKGVLFHFGSKVQQIVHHQKKVKGIEVNNQFFPSDIVVSNADIYFTYKNLLGDSLKSDKLLQLERSSSALIFYWGIGKSFDQLGLHNILFSKNYKEEFDALFHTKTLFDDPTIYINITGKHDKAHAPEGKENWFVMINAPANYGQDWNTYKEKTKKAVINKINRILNTDIHSLIETEEILDPVSIETKTGSYMGSLYGTSSNARLAAFLRPANFAQSIKGLYFCGGTVHPGGGIPLCLKSAYITAELIKAENKN
ncbi:MAG: phytoene desaturase [Ferruginibacter sp.]|nr:phytoene desaturase [Ferruginibacter sp.]